MPTTPAPRSQLAPCLKYAPLALLSWLLAACSGSTGPLESELGDEQVEQVEQAIVNEGTELLSNGAFSSGLTGWSPYVKPDVFVLGGKQRSASATFTPVTNPRGSYLRYIIRNGGRSRADIQLHQPVAIRAGQSYTIAADVQGSLADFEIALQDSGRTRTLAGSSVLVAPARTRKVIVHRFVASETLDNARFVLRLGTTSDYIDRGETQPFAGVRFVDFHTVSLRTDGAGTETNLFQNPRFDQGLQGWTTQVATPAEDAISVVNGEAWFKSDGLAGKEWELQLRQTAAVASGDVFTMSFDAYTTGGGTRPVRLVFEQAATPFTRFVDQVISIDGTRKTYSTGPRAIPFTGTVRFSVMGGDDTRDFRIDNGVLTRAASGGGSGGDSSAPSVASLGLPAVAGARAVPLAISASDDTGVTGYALVDSDPATPTPAMPPLTDSRWQAAPPSTVPLSTALTVGTRRITAWVRDKVGHSASLSEVVALGDLYEPDDTRATARAFPLGGPAQSRSLHAAGDQDWLSFPVRSGASYVVSADQAPLGTTVAVFLGASTTALAPAGGTTVSFVGTGDTTATVRVAGSAAGAYTVSVTGTAQTQLFANANFDTGLSGWTTLVANPSEDAILAETGAARFKVDGAVNQPWEVQLSQTFATTAGEVFSMSFDAATTGGGTRAVQLLMQQEGGARTTYGFAAPTIDGTTRTVRLDNVTIPASGRVKFAIQGGDDNFDFRVDGARLVRAGSVAPFPGRGPAISTTLVGHNFWHPDSFFALGQNAKTAGVRLIRIGGIALDRQPPSASEMLRRVDYVRSLGAEPLVQVSRFGSATAAADLVRFLNVTNGRGLRNWAIGNEPNEDETPPSDIQAYVKSHSQAMRDVDANLTIYTLGNSFAEDPYYVPLLGGAFDITGRDAKGRFFVDGIALNHYPFGDQFARTDAETAAWKLGGDVGKLMRWLATANQKNNRAGSSALKWALTEFNMSYRNPAANAVDGIADRSFLNGQFIAETFGIGMKENAATLTPWSLFEASGDGGPFDVGFLEGPASNVRWRSSMQHLKLIADHFRGFAPATQSSEPLVIAFAAEHSEGVAVAVLNKDNTRGFDYGVALGGQAAPARAVQLWVDSLRTGTYSGNIGAATTQIILFDTSGQPQRLLEYSVDDARAWTGPRAQPL